jgi:hypothetical protein
MTQMTDYSGQSPVPRSELKYSGLPEIYQEESPVLARGDNDVILSTTVRIISC